MASKAAGAPPRKPRTAYKGPRVKALADQGHTIQDISHITGLAYNTVAKYLEEAKAQAKVIQDGKDVLSDLLHLDLLMGMKLKHKVLTTLTDDDVVNMSPSDKKEWVKALTTSVGVTFDKTRLQDGKSTVNTSHRIVLNDAHKLRAQRTTSSVSTPTEQEPVGETPVAIKDSEGQNAVQVVDIVTDNGE